MYRHPEEIAITQRRHKFNTRKLTGRDTDTQAKGRWRKKAPLDCGHTSCCQCHSNKYPRRKPTRQEMKADGE